MNQRYLRTPLIKPRKQGGTFYTFSSALEDIGININESKNKIAMSHYVLLDIPEIVPTNAGDNNNYNVGDYTFAKIFQNYALNMETTLRSYDSYNFSKPLTVSERVFWKFMSKYFGMTFNEVNGDPAGHCRETSGIVKGFGRITAGAQRADAYGLYNETFVQIPSSYGKMDVLFKHVSDANYTIPENTTWPSNILNVDTEESVGIPVIAEYDNGDKYTIGEYDDMCVEFSLDGASGLRAFYNMNNLTYDDLGRDSVGIEDIPGNDEYNFNAILVYYSIYDTMGKVLATNAYGLLLLNSATETSNGNYKFPEIIKTRTSVERGGTSYSFRINTKTSSVYSGDTVVHDESTGSYDMTTSFNDVIRNMTTAVETLRSNANLISNINTDNQSIKNFAKTALAKIDDMSKEIENIKRGKLDRIDVNEIIAKKAVVEKVIEGVYFQDKLGNSLGSIENGSLFFDKANIKTLTGETAEIPTIKGNTWTTDSGFCILDVTGVQISKSDASGTHTKDFYAANPVDDSSIYMDPDDVLDIIENMNVKYNADKKTYSINYVGNSDNEILPTIINTANKEVNLKALVCVLLNGLKQTLESISDSSTLIE